MGHFSVRLKVPLGSDKDHIDICFACLLYLLHPRLNMIEANGVDDGVSQDNAVCSLIKGFCYVSEPLLPCSVPDIKGDLIAIQLDPFDFKINTDCTQVF